MSGRGAATDAPTAHSSSPSGSLRARLLLGGIAWILVALALAGWGLRNLFQEHVEQQLEAQLVLHLNQLSAGASLSPDGSIAVAPIRSDPRFDQPLSGLYWQVDTLQPDGGEKAQIARETIARSRSMWDQVLPLPPLAEAANPARNYRVVSLKDAEGRTLYAVTRNLQLPDAHAPPLRLSVAADSALITAPLHSFTSILLLTLGMLALGLAIAVLIQLQLALRPLQQLRQRLTAVLDGSSAHIEGSFPQELQPLITEFNTVLDTNADMVQRARTQAGNLAHAVHTPLAIMGNAAEQEDSNFARLVREQTSIAKRQIDYHLARARAASAARATGLRTPLLPPLQALVRTMEKLHADRQLRFVVSNVDPQLAFRGEEQDLYELLGNLIDNAGKWATSRVQISARPQPEGMLEIDVDDDGPGLTEAQRQLIFERGVRLDEQRPGSGLGLDIVRELALTYGGDICATKSPLGGLRMQLRLPASAVPPRSSQSH